MQVNVNVSPQMLAWVIENSRIDTLPDKMKDNLNLWIDGSKMPTFNQIEKLSKATHIPLGYFFLQTPPEEDLSIVEYRTVDSIERENPSRDLIDTLHDMEQIQDWMRNALISDGNEPLEFIGSLRNESSVDVFAQKVRTLLLIETEWYKNRRNVEASFAFIRNKISNLGIVVMMSGIVKSNTHRPLDINEFRAFSIIDEYAPLIFINGNDSVNGKLFSLLHEFAHLCIGENSLFNDRYSIGGAVKKTETLCNAVAAEILVPQAVFIKEWKAAICTSDVKNTIKNLARSFKCGSTVIARKAYDNKLIDFQLYQTTAKEAVGLYNESQKRKKAQGKNGGDFYRTASSRIDKRFFSMLVSSVCAGKTLYSDAFRLTNTNRSTFSRLVDGVEGGVK